MARADRGGLTVTKLRDKLREIGERELPLRVGCGLIIFCAAAAVIVAQIGKMYGW